MSVMTPAQMVQFLRATAGDSQYPLWQLMLNTGIRPGEALGLKWGDFTGNTFFIHRVLTRDAHGHHFIKDRPKTNASRRCLTVPAPVMEVLKTHKARQAKDALYYGPHYERNDLVFATKLGRWLDPDSIAKRFRKTITKLGLPKEIRWYDMRHSHATALLSNGVPLAWVSERLGHRDPKMTAHYYAKVLPEAHGQMAEVMEQVLDKAAQQGT